MNRITAFIYRHKVRCNELAKALKLVEHELAYTIRSKNVLTLNSHAKDERLAKLEEQTSYMLKHRGYIHKQAQEIENYKNTINEQKELLLSLEYEIEGLKTTITIANTKGRARAAINFVRDKYNEFRQ